MTTVLYIAGTGRSGSTLLASLLGELPGVFNAGEVRFLWQRGLVERRLCGCGAPVPECPVWASILDTAQPTSRSPESMAQLLRRFGRVRHLPGSAMHLALHQQGAAASPRLAEVRAVLGGLYSAIGEVTGSAVVVDASKLPAYGHLLTAVGGIDLRTVHLVRDPRAAAHSWSSPKPLTDGASRHDMQQIRPLKSASLWDVWNAATGTLLDRGPSSYMRVRYEDLVTNTPATVRRILALIGRDGASLPIDDEGRLRLGPNHTVAGNPDRLRHGVVQVRMDTRWLGSMTARDRILVTVITSPLLLRYGYPLRVHSSDGGGARAARETVLSRSAPDETGIHRLTRRVVLHLHWARTEGVGRLIEEDDLNPVARAQTALAKWRWRRSHPLPAGSATPVYLVGLQRSGTNMLTRGLDRAPEFEVHNENDRAAFQRFLLRSDDVIRGIVERSRHRYVLFKPLCDSHRIDALLDDLGGTTPGRAIWALRDVDGRVRSALSKFGANNLLVLADIAAGRNQEAWQAQRLSLPSIEVIRSFDYSSMTPETAAALFWWARNSLYFELDLDRRNDVMLISYGELLSRPADAMRALCSFLDFAYRPALIEHINLRPPRSVAPLIIDPRVRHLCAELQDRFDGVLAAQHRQWAA